MRPVLSTCLDFLAVVVGSGCGAQPTEPSVGRLLDAPTMLAIKGRAVTAHVQPQVKKSTVRVLVKLRSKRYPTSQLTIKNVYLVTNDGVWSSDVRRLRQRKCSKVCLAALAQGPARGLKAGQGAQVVIALKTPQGQTLFIKDMARQKLLAR